MRAALLICALLLPVSAFADPTAAELLKKYDAIMGPQNYEAVASMVAHRDDDSTRSYKMRILKAGDDKFRAWFDEPSAAKGQEILRQGDNSWVYMPNVKRSMRLASRDSFQGGDFNNADVLRVNYEADYDAKLVPDASMPDAWLLELKAKTSDASYDSVKLWLSKADSMPVKGEYYTASGKMLRSAQFLEIKEFNGLKRPARVVMKNMIATKRYSELVFHSFNHKVTPSAGRFVQDDLGR